VDTDILKPDTGYLAIIERPGQFSPAAGSSTKQSSATGSSTKHSSEHPTSGSRTPLDEDATGPQTYNEPESEGEEDDDHDLLPAKDEDKWARLSGKEVQEAIAYREHMLKARREPDSAGPSGNGKGKTNRVRSARRDADEDADDEDDDPGRVLARGRPPAGKAIPIVKPRTLSIDPLAPSVAFDETLRDRLKSAQEARKQRGQDQRRPGEEEEEEETHVAEEEDEEEDDPLLAKPRDDERRLSRDIRAPAGKRISVPVRIEPKVYFAAERTFLVRSIPSSLAVTLINPLRRNG
jgi:hypothetical protein